LPWKLIGSLVGAAVTVIVVYAVVSFVPLPIDLPFLATVPSPTATEVILPPTPTATETPWPPTATPTKRATFTPVITETATLEVSPTRTVTATATSIVTPTFTAEFGETPAVSPMATARPTEASVLKYAAPKLLEPEDQSGWPEDHPLVFSYGARIDLRWESVGILAENEWYSVELIYTDKQNEPTRGPGGWTKETTWRVQGDDLYNLLGGDRYISWTVTVMVDREATGEGVPISPPSETWMFRWG
jgi:hypothetical protein